jgi:hypothetical protein
MHVNLVFLCLFALSLSGVSIPPTCLPLSVARNLRVDVVHLLAALVSIMDPLASALSPADIALLSSLFHVPFSQACTQTGHFRLVLEGSEELAGPESPQFDDVVQGSASKERFVKRKC